MNAVASVSLLLRPDQQQGAGGVIGPQDGMQYWIASHISPEDFITT